MYYTTVYACTVVLPLLFVW